VNLEEAEMLVNEISKERKSLSRSMRDVDSAIRKLDDVLVAIVLIIAIFVMISFLNTNFATTLATAGTALLSLSFIFAVTCQEILASILFLFYKVPYHPLPHIHTLVLFPFRSLGFLVQWVNSSTPST
jgi:small-conductance mechanosensitive channel